MSNQQDTNNTGNIDRILRVREISARTGLSKASVYRLKTSGVLKFIKIGVRSLGVRESVFNAWLDSREIIEPANDENTQEVA